MNDQFDVGRLLGRREAFTIIAARCSAAEAEQLRRIREDKLYLAVTQDWEEFCVKFLHMSKDTANRIIRMLEEFGTTYFDVAQFTRISPATYRAIAPSIRDKALHHNGDVIALIPENAEQIAAAVAALRKPAPRALPPAPPEDSIPQLEKDCTDVLRRIEALIERREWDQPLRAVICSLYERLRRLELTL